MHVCMNICVCMCQCVQLLFIRDFKWLGLLKSIFKPCKHSDAFTFLYNQCNSYAHALEPLNIHFKMIFQVSSRPKH